MSEEVFICIECIFDERLKKRIRENDKIIKSCSFCKNTTILGVSTEDIWVISSPINAIIKYEHGDYKDITQRNSFGKYYHEVITEENFFSDQIDVKTTTYQILLNSIFTAAHGGVTPKSAANYRYNEPYKSGGWLGIDYDFADDEDTDILNLIKKYIDSIKDLLSPEPIMLPSNLFRARVGAVILKKELGPDEKKNPDENFCQSIPFSGDKISAPQSSIASSGRANRQGISVLYLAKDEYTAVCEVRAVPGDYVSIGEFTANSKLKIANFFNPSLEDFWNSDEQMELLRKTISYGRRFSRPVGSNGVHKYLLTQILSELLAVEGFDGICYKSHYSDKQNYAIFNPEKFKYVENSGKQLYIEKVKVNYRIGSYRVYDA